jgi:murein DD-endopeptidase MepM/ murein hydrolase activator NlpD
VTDGYEEGGTTADMLQKANSVLIQHQDSTVAYYSHLQHGIPVKVGDNVKRGAMIAYSGNTGLSSGPHLHFAVKHLEIQPGRGTSGNCTNPSV